MQIKTNNPSTPLWKLERIGPRSKDVVAKHGDDPRVVRFRETIPPLVDQFLEVRSDVVQREGDTRRRNTQAKADATALYGYLQPVLRNVVQDFPDIDATLYSERPNVIEHVIVHARTLLHVVQTDLEATGRELPYTAELLGQLGALVERAEESQRLAEEASTALQERREVQRESATALHRELVGLRSVLRATLGPRHRDYRQLRLQPGSGDPGADAVEASTEANDDAA